MREVEGIKVETVWAIWGNPRVERHETRVALMNFGGTTIRPVSYRYTIEALFPWYFWWSACIIKGLSRLFPIDDNTECSWFMELRLDKRQLSNDYRIYNVNINVYLLYRHFFCFWAIFFLYNFILILASTAFPDWQLYSTDFTLIKGDYYCSVDKFYYLFYFNADGCSVHL